jgi:hypothetical protein
MVLPKFGVTGFAFDDRSRKQALVSVVDGVVRPMHSGNQVVKIERELGPSMKILRRERIDVMNKETLVDLVAVDA